MHFGGTDSINISPEQHNVLMLLSLYNRFHYPWCYKQFTFSPSASEIISIDECLNPGTDTHKMMRLSKDYWVNIDNLALPPQSIESQQVNIYLCCLNLNLTW